MSARLYDPGLQPERTLLAWRRTCLALGLWVAVIIRYGSEVDPVMAVSIGTPALFGIIAAYGMTAVRYRTVTRSLSSERPQLASGGPAITVLAMVVSGVALVSLFFVSVRAVG